MSDEAIFKMATRLEREFRASSEHGDSISLASWEASTLAEIIAEYVAAVGQRKYSTNEIDEMRTIIARDFPQRWSSSEGRDRSFDAAIEERLRTYVAAGISPEEFLTARRGDAARTALSDQAQELGMGYGLTGENGGRE